MTARTSLIVDLEDAVQRGSPERRAETLRRITDLFLGSADRFTGEQVALFDDVMGRLIDRIETRALAELSRRLGPVANAPEQVLRRLARNDAIAVAGPVLAQSPRLAEADLVDIAASKSQAHLLAIDHGTFASGMPGEPAKQNPGYGLLGAIVETPAGNYFFKLTGPMKTVKSAEQTFLKLLDSIKVESGV